MKIPKIDINKIDLTKVELPRCIDTLGNPILHACWKCKFARNRGKAYDKCQDKFIKQGWCYTFNLNNN